MNCLKWLIGIYLGFRFIYSHPHPPHAHVIPGVSSITGHHPRQLQSHSSPHLLIICTAWQQSACYLLKHALGGPATDIHNSN